MRGLHFALWVLLLAVLFQVSSWQAQKAHAWLDGASAISLQLSASRDADAPEESSEEPSLADPLLDDSFTPAALPSGLSGFAARVVSGWCAREGGGLSQGRLPLDALFKPPRA
jgi:hypothetical protein